MAKMYIEVNSDTLVSCVPKTCAGRKRMEVKFHFDNKNRERTIDFVFKKDKNDNTFITIYRNRNMDVKIDGIPTEF